MNPEEPTQGRNDERTPERERPGHDLGIALALINLVLAAVAHAHAQPIIVTVITDTAALLLATLLIVRRR